MADVFSILVRNGTELVAYGLYAPYRVSVFYRFVEAWWFLVRPKRLPELLDGDGQYERAYVLPMREDGSPAVLRKRLWWSITNILCPTYAWKLRLVLPVAAEGPPPGAPIH